MSFLSKAYISICPGTGIAVSFHVGGVAKKSLEEAAYALALRHITRPSIVPFWVVSAGDCCKELGQCMPNRHI